MEIAGFIWLNEIVDNILQKHHVTPLEVESVFHSKPKYRFVEEGDYLGEDVYLALGQTGAGRYLVVFFVYKKDKRALILSGRNMTRREQRQYGRK